MNSRLSAMFAGLLGILLIGCEKVPTFQELTGQDAANKTPPAVETTAAPTVTPAAPTLEVKPVEPQQPVVTEDPAAVIAMLNRTSAEQVADRDIVRATKIPSVVAELKSLNVSGSAVTDEGVRLLGQFPALVQADLSSLQINGAGIEGLEPLSNLRELRLMSVKMGSSSGWEHLSRLSQVETLNLTSTNITDADVPVLISMTGLKDLNISNTVLTDAALAHLAKLENLEILRMENTPQIKGTGLKAFVQSKRKPGLRCLFAANTALTKEGMSNVKRIASLELFDNTYCHLTDQLLFELKGATNLKTLIIGSNDLSSASGLTLRTMGNLENLDLRQNPAVNAQILTSLVAMTDLRTLNLSRTTCTPESIEEFRRRRKNCEVIFE